MSTKENLTTALTEANAPDWLIKNASNGHYDDFESEITSPITTLVDDCRRAGLNEIAKRAINGEFDATAEESEAWIQCEGKEIFK